MGCGVGWGWHWVDMKGGKGKEVGGWVDMKGGVKKNLNQKASNLMMVDAVKKFSGSYG